MSRSVELPDPHFERLEEAAAAEGVTPAEWIERRLPQPYVQPSSNGKPARTLAERFAGRVGVIASGGKERLSERASEIFGDMLEEQRNAGRL
jgi:hypothetical protein